MSRAIIYWAIYSCHIPNKAAIASLSNDHLKKRSRNLWIFGCHSPLQLENLLTWLLDSSKTSVRHLNPLYFLVTSLRNVHTCSWKFSWLYLIMPTTMKSFIGSTFRSNCSGLWSVQSWKPPGMEISQYLQVTGFMGLILPTENFLFYLFSENIHVSIYKQSLSTHCAPH